jgi:2-polyprenyl-3-methyl-5-hydroxy-6-metoxy-1,4-benzoquinol methylase
MSAGDRRLGFVFDRPLELRGWRTLEIDARVPLEDVPSCPAGDGVMRPLATFLDRTGSTRVRLGCCPSCGHISYMDRPTAEWMNTYYLDNWDSDDVEARVESRGRKLAAPRKREKLVVTLAKQLPDVDRSRPVCEIGSGWGVSLKHLIDGGFSNVVGTEASRHRARVIEEALRVPILTAPFESAAARQFLAERGPYAVIVSNHVIEHTYDPSAVLGVAASVQRPGDYLIVAVPNQETEPAMSVFFFLPHLHSFSRASLEGVAARHGYSVVDDRHMHPKQVLLVFRKGGAPVPPSPPAPAAFDRAIERYAESFALSRLHVGPRRVWWPSRGGPTASLRMFGFGRFEQRRWARIVQQRAYAEPRSIAVRALWRRRTSAAESPIEVRFNGPLLLFCK